MRAAFNGLPPLHRSPPRQAQSALFGHTLSVESSRARQATRMEKPATLAVETHGDALWLCAVAAGDVALLARFTTDAAAERFKALLGHTIAAAHAAGASGI